VIESDLVQTVLDISLLVMVGLLIVTSWRVVVGPSPADRLQAIDMITTILIGVIVLLSMVEVKAFYISIALALAALSFVATVSIARYIQEGRMF